MTRLHPSRSMIQASLEISCGHRLCACCRLPNSWRHYSSSTSISLFSNIKECRWNTHHSEYTNIFLWNYILTSFNLCFKKIFKATQSRVWQSVIKRDCSSEEITKAQSFRVQFYLRWTSDWYPVVHLVVIGDVDLVALALAGQLDRPTSPRVTTLDLSLPTSGGRPYCGATTVERRDCQNWLRDDDDDNLCCEYVAANF